MCNSGGFQAHWLSLGCGVNIPTIKGNVSWVLVFSSVQNKHVFLYYFSKLHFWSWFRSPSFFAPVSVCWPHSSPSQPNAHMSPIKLHVSVYAEVHVFLGWVLFAKSGPVFTDNDLIFFVSFPFCVLFLRSWSFQNVMWPSYIIFNRLINLV